MSTPLPSSHPWAAFFGTPVSGDAKILALRLACEPYRADVIEPRNIRAFAEELRMTIFELERAFNEIRDPRVAWTTGHHYDRPVLKRDALPRMLLDGVPPAHVIEAMGALKRDEKKPQIAHGVVRKGDR